MAMNVGDSAEGESYSDINMTPLIDIMLVLLIIFIITIPVMTHAVKIDNPLPPAFALIGLRQIVRQRRVQIEAGRIDP